MSITVSVRLDDHAQAYRLAAQLTERFGFQAVDVFDAEEDEGNAAEDIHLMHDVQTILATAGSPEAARSQLRELQPTYGKSNDQMRYIDDVIASLDRFVTEHPEHVEPDQAPPRGIKRPEAPLIKEVDPDLEAMLNQPGFDRPKTQAGGADHTRRRAMIADMVPCPTCGAGIGEYCRGSKPGSSNYGAHTMHQSRIDLVFGKQS